MAFVYPVIGHWYRRPDGDLFEVVAVDEQDATIEIQFCDGTIDDLLVTLLPQELADSSTASGHSPDVQIIEVIFAVQQVVNPGKLLRAAAGKGGRHPALFRRENVDGKVLRSLEGFAAAR